MTAAPAAEPPDQASASNRTVYSISVVIVGPTVVTSLGRKPSAPAKAAAPKSAASGSRAALDVAE